MKKFFWPYPQQHRTNFIHLYLEIAWFGVLTGSTVSFLSVYLARQGASVFQMGLLSASPALMTMIFALPAGRWLKNRPFDHAVFITSVLYRLFYALWVPLPALFGAQFQTWITIVITLLMSIPGTAFAVGFNSLFALAVPIKWRDQVAGVRNAVLAITTTLTSLFCGFLLDRITFPMGYQIVFAIGLLGAGMSSFHLRQIHVPKQVDLGKRNPTSLGMLLHPGLFRTSADAMRPAIGLRFLKRLTRWRLSDFGLPRSSYQLILLALFIFHVMQYLGIPIFPLYYVDELGLSDQQISLGNALFYAFFFVSSTQLVRVIKWLGLHQSTALGALLICVFPGLLAISRDYGMYLFTMIIAGLFSSLHVVALSNYLLDITPECERPMYLAWYMLALNAAILVGSLAGPFVAQRLGLVPTLAVVAIGRAISAIGIWASGRFK